MELKQGSPRYFTSWYFVSTGLMVDTGGTEHCKTQAEEQASCDQFDCDSPFIAAKNHYIIESVQPGKLNSDIGHLKYYSLLVPCGLAAARKICCDFLALSCNTLAPSPSKHIQCLASRPTDFLRTSIQRTTTILQIHLDMSQQFMFRMSL
jgi:hypothetical protein